MRYVIVPEPVRLVSPDKQSPLRRTMPDGSEVDYVVDLAHFVELFITNDLKFGVSHRSQRAAIRWEEATQGAAPGGAVVLDEPFWDIGRDVVESPSHPIGFQGPNMPANELRMRVHRQCWCFSEAILNAKTDPPKS